MTSFPVLLQAFFRHWLGDQRNLSRHTVLSYRDTWRLFLRFVAGRKVRAVAQLVLTDLTDAEVLAFLQYCEDDRHTSISTRNCRLAALRSFFRFVADREPTVAAQCAAILRIPTKRTSTPALCYLDADEITAILDQPDRSTSLGQRDHVLLSILYNTGARIQEALNLCPRALRLDPPAQVKLFGKGRKERISPLWPETADLLTAFLRRQPRAEDEPIFRNRFGRSSRSRPRAADSDVRRAVAQSPEGLRRDPGALPQSCPPTRRGRDAEFSGRVPPCAGDVARRLSLRRADA